MNDKDREREMRVEPGYDWFRDELAGVAERAKERGMAPEEVLSGLRTFADHFEQDEADAMDVGGQGD